jgi:hypothetical protein
MCRSIASGRGTWRGGVRSALRYERRQANCAGCLPGDLRLRCSRATVQCELLGPITARGTGKLQHAPVSDRHERVTASEYLPRIDNHGRSTSTCSIRLVRIDVQAAKIAPRRLGCNRGFLHTFTLCHGQDCRRGDGFVSSAGRDEPQASPQVRESRGSRRDSCRPAVRHSCCPQWRNRTTVLLRRNSDESRRCRHCSSIGRDRNPFAARDPLPALKVRPSCRSAGPAARARWELPPYFGP